MQKEIFGLLQKMQRNEFIMLLVSPLAEPVTGLPGSYPAYKVMVSGNLVPSMLGIFAFQVKFFEGIQRLL